MPNFKNKLKLSQRGMTLIEIMVALGIAAVVMGAAASYLTSPVSRQMKKDAVHLTALIKYLYTEANLKGQYIQLVFDIDGKTVKAQASEKPFYIVREDDEAERLRKKNEDDDKGADEAKPAGADGGFAEIEDLEDYKLQADVKIADIFVQHSKEKITEGKVSLYFFPRGLTEFAVLHLSDEDGESFVSLIVNPLTGTVEIKAEYVEPEDLLEAMEPES